MAKENGPSSHASTPSDLESLGQRLNAAKAKHAPPDTTQDDGTLLGMAWRLSTELIVAVLVGAGLGYGLDLLFGTAPWITLIGLGFGFAAGIKNTLRVAEKMDAKTAQIPIGDDIQDEPEDD